MSADFGLTDEQVEQANVIVESTREAVMGRSNDL